MSVPMKKRRTSNAVEILIHEGETKKFLVPKEQAKGLTLLLNDFKVDIDKKINIPADTVFRHLDDKYTRPGAALQGARLKEEMSQVELADKLGISQTDLSKMEHGKRPIGKKMAKRLASALKIDYRVFL